MMTHLLATTSLIERALSLPTIVFLFAGAIAITAILGGIIQNIMIARAREQTRREIAAYVAEGSIPPDKAIEMLRAKPQGKKSGRSCGPLC